MSVYWICFGSGLAQFSQTGRISQPKVNSRWSTHAVWSGRCWFCRWRRPGCSWGRRSRWHSAWGGPWRCRPPSGRPPPSARAGPRSKGCSGASRRSWLPFGSPRWPRWARRRPRSPSSPSPSGTPVFLQGKELHNELHSERSPPLKVDESQYCTHLALFFPSLVHYTRKA